MQRFTGSFVPTIFAHASQFDDPVLRDARNVTDNFLSRVPLLGYRKELPARRDIFGDIRTADQGLGIGTFSPIRLSAMKNDPVYNELYDLGMYPSMPTRKLRNIELQPKEYEELLSLQKQLKTKERMNRIINTPGYKNLPQFRKKNY